MRIDPVQSIKSFEPITKLEKPEETGGVSFKDTIKNAIGSVNDLQNQADDMSEKLASGDLEDVHQAILAMNKAKMTFDFTVAVRNKVLEAYQEVIKTQI